MQDKMKILMVDDKPENLFVLEEILKDEDIIIEKAISGNEALSMLLEDDYGLVLMDVQMPELDGFETAELMKGMKKTKYIPIIFVTAISKEEYFVFKGYNVGAIDYIYKPIEPLVLKSKVRVFAELHYQKVMYRDQAKVLNEKVMELQEVKEQLIELNSKLVQISTIDGLTQIANRRFFDERLGIEWGRAKREQKELSLLLLDIDYFKQYNDVYGHIEGDECLKAVAAAIQDCVYRPADFVARFGGEEFTVILPDTSFEGAIHIAETIREKVESLKIQNCGSIAFEYVTISIGVVTKEAMHTTIKEFIECADKALYKAKNLGRNKVVGYDSNKKLVHDR